MARLQLSNSFSIHRREFLRLGMTGAASLSLAELNRLRAEQPLADSAQNEKTAVILVWLIGGASHLETYDPKPQAPSDYRGPFLPIETNVPGLNISELLPMHAKIADKMTVIRSLTHSGGNHQQGAQQLLTGHDIQALKNKPDHPDLFSIAHRLRYDVNHDIPNYVGLQPTPYVGPAYLGTSYEPFAVYNDPNLENFAVPNLGTVTAEAETRLTERISLRKRFDRLQQNLEQIQEMQALNAFEQQAANVLTSTNTREAFDIKQESAAIRDRYGRNQWGQQLLLARRLIESGVELITTTLNGSLCGRIHNWDDHAVNHHCFDVMKARAPYYDQAVTALIEDLFERGLNKRVMVVVTGEFGRTPRISYANDSASGIMQPGRDHWPNATSLIFAGGGIPTGQIVGATDPRGEEVVERRISREDFLMTLYRHLGIDPRPISFTDYSGRPIPILLEGEVVPELSANS
ncbi:hypothetical protein Pla110_24220 [Polystyrenella longa]|uniref:DUF1501 domain-containing protein n=1 Tax=Polystyrenella longa TaxID=2528007 RepID=A0A518CN89_9PLAN|nr:DUF1501 domain-containing protein [Polystyrenella longa]QDU80690.1 hypothetical protein Pla110_24220 [Polystyrenella longa]